MLVLAACPSSSQRDAGLPPPPARVIAPPTITRVGPALIVPFSVTSFGLEGVAFGGSAGDSATLTVTRVRDLDGNLLSGPTLSTVAVPVDVPRTQLQRVFIDVDPAQLPPGVYDAAVRTNLGEASFADAFVIPPEPAVRLERDTLCAPASVVVVGENIYRLAGYPLPLLYWPGAYEHWFPATSGCREVIFRLPGLELCTRVEDPDPVPEGIAAHGWVTLALPGIPYDALARLTWELWIDHGMYSVFDWPRAAVDAPLDLRVWGGLTPVAGNLRHRAWLGDVPLDVRGERCSQSEGAPDVLACLDLVATVPQGFAPGDHVLRVETAPGCTGTGPLTLAPRPAITSLTPVVTCTRRADPITVCGEGLVAAGIDIGGLQYSSELSGRCLTAWPYATSRPLLPGTYSVALVNNSFPPVVSDPVTLTVGPGPADVGPAVPGHVYSGATRRVFLAVTNGTGPVRSAVLVPQGGEAIPIDVTGVEGGVEITVPPLGGAGSYVVRISDGSPCPADGVLSTTDTSEVVRDTFDAPTRTVYTTTETTMARPELLWLEGQGVTGGAVGAAHGAGGPEWYFAAAPQYHAFDWPDLGALAFDLRASGSGDVSTAPSVMVRYWSHQVEYSLPVPPAGVWTRYELDLADAAGWTYRDAGGSRPATRRDLLGSGNREILILGSWWSGPGEAALDNLSLELVR